MVANLYAHCNLCTNKMDASVIMASKEALTVNTKSQRSSTQNKVPKSLPSPKKVSTSPSRSDRSSPDPACAICLGKHVNKCFTNSCLHEFCFACLVEWSKVKPECPLCKQQFNAIIHNVRSNHEYDEYKIVAQEPEEPEFSALDGIPHRFRYRTTLTNERRRVLELERLMAHYAQNGFLPTVRSRPRRRSQLTGTSNFRRQIYLRDLWVRPLSDITGRYRETTPEFFQMNTAMTHRLVPWLNRELNILLEDHENRLSYVLELILRLITQHHISSRSFREAIQQYTGENTEHFIHEFFQFARSPFDMYGFDENAQYEPRAQLYHEEVAISESSDEEISIHPISNQPSNLVQEPAYSLSPQPGPSGLGRGPPFNEPENEASSELSGRNSSDVNNDEIEVVEVLKPRRDRTPELITLSDSDEESGPPPSRRSPSRGKSLKRKSRAKTNTTESHKEKRLKKRRRSRSRSPHSSREREKKRSHRMVDDKEWSQPLRYWELDPDEFRDVIHSRSRSSSTNRRERKR